MKNLAEIRKAFRELPSRITAAQIAEATGRAHIHNWTKDPTFPTGKNDLGGRTIYRDRDAVWKWYTEQSFADTDRPGPRDLNAKVLAARPAQVLMDSAELGDLLDLTRRAVNKYAERNQAGASKDPFPLANPDGKRSWSQVRAWFLRRNDPMPSAGEHGAHSWADLRTWLLRHVDDGTEPVDGHVYLDDLGLTVGQRDAVERARLTLSRNVGVVLMETIHHPMAEVLQVWLPEVLHLEEPGQASWLGTILTQPDTAPIAPSPEDAPRPAQQPRRLRPTALARELGLKVEAVKHFARKFTPDQCEDPFPAKDSSSARDVAEVSAWLARNRKTRPAEDAETSPARAASAVARENAAIRAWAKENGHEVGDRGRISTDIREAYEQANG